MATVIDTLAVRIEADLSDLRRDLNKVAKQTDTANKKMKESFRSLGKVIASVASVAVLGAFVKSSIQTGASVENLRVQMNALLGTVEEGGKAFEIMTEFASKVPFSLDAIQKGAGSLAAASKNATELKELLQVTGNIAAQFGIPFNEAAANVQRAMSAGIGAADQFRDRGVSAFAGFEAGVSYSSAQTSEKLIKAFGTGGTADGAMSEFAKTTTGVQSMFEDAMFKMRRAFAEGGLNEGFKKILGSLINLANSLTPLVSDLGALANMIASILTPAINFLADNILILQAALLLVIARFVIYRTAALAFAGVTALMSSSLVTLNGILTATKALMLTILPLAIFAGLAWLIAKFLELKNNTGSMGEALSLLKDIFAAAFESMKATLTSFGIIFGGLRDHIYGLWIGVLSKMKIKFSEFLLDVAAQLSNVPMMGGKAESLQTAGMFGLGEGIEMGAEASAMEHAFENAKIKAKEVRDEGVIPLIASIAFLKEVMEESGAEEAQVVALNDVNIAVDELLDNLEKQTPLMQTFQSAVATMATGFSDSMADMLLSGKTNSEALKNVFRSFVKTMLSKAIELMFINAILNSIFGLTGKSALPTIPIPGRASGGKVGANQPYLVGERGPELFVPSSAGNIKNNSDTSSMGGGKGTVINQVINVSAGVSQTVRDEMNSLLPRIKQETMMSVADAKRRGGAYGASMG